MQKLTEKRLANEAKIKILQGVFTGNSHQNLNENQLKQLNDQDENESDEESSKS